MMEEPLIWTSKGNLPIKDLECTRTWENTESNVIFAEEYRLNGEIVKRAAHVYIKKPLNLAVEQGKSGG